LSNDFVEQSLQTRLECLVMSIQNVIQDALSKLNISLHRASLNAGIDPSYSRRIMDGKIKLNDEWLTQMASVLQECGLNAETLIAINLYYKYGFEILELAIQYGKESIGEQSS
jgi:hypothetical protein